MNIRIGKLQIIVLWRKRVVWPNGDPQSRLAPPDYKVTAYDSDGKAVQPLVTIRRAP